MRKTTRIVALITGIMAGLAAMEHGVFEILQKGSHSQALVFPAMGTPCDPIVAWNACEPAMSFISDYLTMGILTITFGLIMSLWSAFYIHKKSGGWVTLILSIIMLLFGGGFFPPAIGIFSSIVALFIHKPIKTQKVNGFTRMAAKLWPWPFVYFPLWGISQFVIGYYFNNFLKENMLFFTLLFMLSLPLTVLSAYSHDVVNEPVKN
jgi:hypothetical protein